MLFHVGIAFDDTDGKTNGHQDGNKIIEISWLSLHIASILICLQNK